MALRLINPENLCFAHATILAFFWGFLHLRHCEWTDLGEAARPLVDLCGRSSLWVDVRDLDCWNDWLACWGDGRQHDAHEFLKAFLGLHTSTCSDRLMGQEDVHRRARGTTAYLPPSLITM